MVMTMKYNPSEIEPKWQEKWESAGVFHASNDSDKPKFYALIEFPYPSGQGLRRPPAPVHGARRRCEKTALRRL